MQYVMTFHETEDELAKREDPEAADHYWGAWAAYMRAIAQAGIMRGGEGLQPPHTASTVRVVDGKREVHDGPFADTKEQLGGFCVIEVDDLDAALDWAAKAPCAGAGSIEVRPILPRPPQ